MGSMCLVKENASDQWEGDVAKGLGAPDRWNGSSVVWERAHPSAPKNPKAVKAVSDTPEAELAHWAFGRSQAFSHPRWHWVPGG